MSLKILLVEDSHFLFSVLQLLDDLAVDRSRSTSTTQHRAFVSRSFLLPKCPVEQEVSSVIVTWSRHCLIPRQRHRGRSVASCLANGIGGWDFFLEAFRDVLLEEDLSFICSGLLGSRSFVLVVVCKHCITVLHGRLSPALVLVLADADRVCDRVFGAERALGLGRRLEDDAEGFCFFSSSVVAESTEMLGGSSAVDSPAAGAATSPPTKVIAVSALDPEAIADVGVQCQSPCVGRACG